MLYIIKMLSFTRRNMNNQKIEYIYFVTTCSQNQEKNIKLDFDFNILPLNDN